MKEADDHCTEQHSVWNCLTIASWPTHTRKRAGKTLLDFNTVHSYHRTTSPDHACLYLCIALKCCCREFLCLVSALCFCLDTAFKFLGMFQDSSVRADTRILGTAVPASALLSLSAFNAKGLGAQFAKIGHALSLVRVMGPFIVSNLSHLNAIAVHRLAYLATRLLLRNLGCMKSSTISHRKVDLFISHSTTTDLPRPRRKCMRFCRR